MTTMLQILTWTLLLAIAQVVLVAVLRSRETGVAYGVGPRDGPAAPCGRIAGRLKRAHDNLYESLPLFATAVLISHVDGKETALAVTGAWKYFIGRLTYVPAYAIGLPYLRTLVFFVSATGLGLVLLSLFL